MTKNRRKNSGIHGPDLAGRVQKNNEALSIESNAALIRKHDSENDEHYRITQALLWQIKVRERALEIMGRQAKYEVHEYMERAEKEISAEDSVYCDGLAVACCMASPSCAVTSSPPALPPNRKPVISLSIDTM